MTEYLSHRVASTAEPPDEVSLPDGVIDASFGEPDPGLFPLDLIRDAASAVLSAPSAALQYSPLRGHTDLIETVAAWMRPEAEPAETVLTSGSIPALLLLTHAMVDPGDTVLFEDPGYFRASAILRAHGANLLPLRHTRDGLDLDAVRHALPAGRTRRSFAYVHPSFQNPSGYTWSLEERREFLAFCARRGIVVVEDTAYDELWCDEPPPPSLRSLADGHPVIQIGTLSKIIAPGMGVGWIIAPAALASVLVDNRVEFGGVGGLTSAMAAAVLRDARFGSYVGDMRRAYAERCHRFAHGVRSIPELVNWPPPSGGYYAWLPLPRGVSDDCFARVALTAGLRVLEGRHFFQTSDHERDFVRLTFGRLAPQAVDGAVSRLATAYRRIGGR
ncbi:PLP-dependent aminotransferase family protein [Streptomyces phaeochromogenes]|nr:PLP-dependent aminotransferase family protein [Streptomyces phaeochromogenes]